MERCSICHERVKDEIAHIDKVHAGESRSLYEEAFGDQYTTGGFDELKPRKYPHTEAPNGMVNDELNVTDDPMLPPPDDGSFLNPFQGYEPEEEPEPELDPNIGMNPDEGLVAPAEGGIEDQVEATEPLIEEDDPYHLDRYMFHLLKDKFEGDVPNLEVDPPVEEPIVGAEEPEILDLNDDATIGDIPEDESGTPEGAKKGWDTRGRGGGADDINTPNPDEQYPYPDDIKTHRDFWDYRTGDQNDPMNPPSNISSDEPSGGLDDDTGGLSPAELAELPDETGAFKEQTPADLASATLPKQDIPEYDEQLKHDLFEYGWDVEDETLEDAGVTPEDDLETAHIKLTKMYEKLTGKKLDFDADNPESDFYKSKGARTLDGVTDDDDIDDEPNPWDDPDYDWEKQKVPADWEKDQESVDEEEESPLGPKKQYGEEGGYGSGKGGHEPWMRDAEEIDALTDDQLKRDSFIGRATEILLNYSPEFTYDEVIGKECSYCSEVAYQNIMKKLGG